VTVVLKAINSQFDQSYTESSKKTKALGDQVHATTTKSRQSMSDLGRGSLVMGGVLLTGFALAARGAMQFEKQMSEVGAVSGANVKQLKLLSDAALQAGKATVFSANDAARAEAELAKGGVAVKDILGGGLTGALNLASAGQLDVGRAAEIAATSMVQFSLAGKDVPHIADLLAAGANKALGSVEDLSVGLKYVGPIAAQMGVSIDQVVGTLAELAQSGVLADQAGTSLRGVLSALTSPSKMAQKEMDRLGISVFDASGKFIGLDGVAGQLQTSMGGLTEKERSNALGRIFGNEQLTAARILFKGGAQDIQAWTAAVNQNGYAADLAAKKMNNLSGDVENLKGSLETALIKSGSTANDTLRSMTQAANDVVGAYIDLPPAAQGAATAFTGIAGATLLVAGGALVLIPKIAALDEALKTMTGGAVGARRALGGIGKGAAIAGAVYGIQALVDAINNAGQKSAPQVDALSASLLTLAGSGQTTGELLRVTGKDFSDLRGKIDDAGKSASMWDFAHLEWSTGTRTVKEARADIEALDKALAGLVAGGHADKANAAFKDIAAALGSTGMSQADIQKRFSGYYDALGQVVVTSGNAATAIDKTTGKINDQAVAAKGAADALLGQADALKALTDPVFALQSALSGQIDAQAALTKAVTEHGRGSKEASDALFALAKANVDVTSSADGLAAAITTGSTSVGQMSQQMQAWVSQGLLTQAQADALRGKVEKLIGKTDMLSGALDRVGTKHLTPTVTLQGADKALQTLQQLAAELDRVGNATALLVAPLLPTPKAAQGPVDPHKVLFPHKAAGGLLEGPGTGTSDSMLIHASTGEFVVNANATQHNLPLLKAINAAPRFAAGGLVNGYAAGGLVNYNPRGGSASSQALNIVRHGGTADDIRALAASWNAYLAKLDHVAQREKLLSDLRHAHSKQDIVAARDALKAFDQTAKIDSQRAAIERLIAVKDRDAARTAKLNELYDNRFQLGMVSAKAEEASLTKRMAKLEKYSNEWTALYQQRAQIEKDVAAHDAQLTDNRYQMGVLSAQQEIASLTARLAGLEKYSNEWMQVNQQIEQVKKDTAAHDAQLMDNRYQLGLATAAEEEASLTRRMAGLEEYSNEWMQLNAQLEQVKAKEHQTALDTVTLLGPSTPALTGRMLQSHMVRAETAGQSGTGGSAGANNSRTVQTGDIILQGTSATPQQLVTELGWMTRG
jgi:TP901 family phage tail tape measure protein